MLSTEILFQCIIASVEPPKAPQRFSGILGSNWLRRRMHHNNPLDNLDLPARRDRLIRLACMGAILGGAWAAYGQTTLGGSSLAFKSAGSNVMTQNGYVGTYITLAAPGTVSLSVNAQAASGSGVVPHLNIVVNDSISGWNTTTTATNYNTSLYLPAGTHFVRTELNNYSSRSLTVNSLQVTGATIANTNNNTNALAAANTYINNYRKGSATVSLTGPGGIPLLPGTNVSVDLKKHAFKFGGTIDGFTYNDVNAYLNNPSYSNFILNHFNSVVPANAGKWAYHEGTRDVVTMSGVDRVLQYAQDNKLDARMHAMLWASNNTQQPGWVETLLNNAVAGNATAKSDLRAEISERIAYYVGDSDADTNDGDRSRRYIEVDILNEHEHENRYWNVYGPAGIASIFSEARNAIAAAGSNARLYLNEYNVLQWSGDNYSNWYRQDVEAVNSAGFGTVVTGIGIQYYPRHNPDDELYNPHSPARMMGIFNNLAVTGLPLSLTEFASQNGTDAQKVADLDDTMRMVFGNPNMNVFNAWGIGQFFDANYNLTPLGVRYELLMSQWDTYLNTTTDATGAITFNGFFGDYNIGGQSLANLALQKGIASYTASLTAPPTWSLWNTANSGTWGNSGNWTTGGVATGIGQTAYFGSAAATRSITNDSPRSLGMLAFNSASSYTLAGSTISLNGNADVAAIHVVAGSHVITAPLHLIDNTIVTIQTSDAMLTLANLLPTTAALTKTGLGKLSIGRMDVGTLNIQAGTVEGTGGVNLVDNLTVSAGATLDLRDQSLIVDYAFLSPLTQIRSLLASGYHGGDWAGTGITSATAAAASFTENITALAYAEASQLGLTSFGGQSFNGDAVILLYTFSGDASMDGKVTTQDFNQLAGSFGMVSGGRWLDGDFTYDGAVSSIDFNLLAANYGQSMPVGAASLGSVIPEPSAFSMITIAWAAMRASRRAARTQ